MNSRHASDPQRRDGCTCLKSNAKGKTPKQAPRHYEVPTPRRYREVSEEIRLLHDAQELLFVDLPVSVSVSFVDHLLQLLVGHPLAELLCDPLQILEGDLACLVVVKETEGLQDLVFRIAVQDLVGHHLQELLVADGAAAIIVNVGDHLLDLLLLRLETKGAHRYLQLFAVDLSRAIGVEEVESFLDLLLLLLCELFLLLASGVEATKSHAFNGATASNEVELMLEPTL